MRALAFLGLVACSPDIATGAYLCGPEQGCPSGQVCNGVDNTCVIPTSAMPFACDPATETHEPDEDATHAASLGTLDCANAPILVNGCLAAHDGADWISFVMRPDCTTGSISASIASPLAFEPVTVDLFDATGTTKLAGADATCPNTSASDTTGEYADCLQQALTPGTSYTLRVTPTGDANCGGSCAFNRYRLTVLGGR
jgi:hypothetical protein